MLPSAQAHSNGLVAVIALATLATRLATVHFRYGTGIEHVVVELKSSFKPVPERRWCARRNSRLGVDLFNVQLKVEQRIVLSLA